MRKFIAGILALLTLVTVSGCQSKESIEINQKSVQNHPSEQKIDEKKDEESAPAEPDIAPDVEVWQPKERVDITIFEFDIDSPYSGNKAMLDAFKKTHDDMIIRLEMVPGGGGAFIGGAGSLDYWRRNSAIFTQRIAAGDAPDIMFLDRAQIAEYASQNLLMPLDPLLASSHLSMDQFENYAADEVVFDGKVWGLPYESETMLFYWNKDIFKEEGLNPNRPPDTWDQVLDLSKKLTKVDKKGNFQRAGFLGFYGKGDLYNYIYSDHQDFLDESGRVTLINFPENVAAMDFVLNTYNQLGGIKKLKPFMENAPYYPYHPFYEGHLTMMVDSHYRIKDIAAMKPELNYGVDYIPNRDGEDNTTWSNGLAWVILRSCKYPKEAFEIIKWFTTEGYKFRVDAEAPVYNAYYEGKRDFVPILCDYIPIREQLNKDYTDKLPERIREIYEKAQNMARFSRHREVSPLSLLMFNELVKAEEDILKGKATAQQGLDQAASNIQKALDQAVYDVQKALVEYWPEYRYFKERQ